MMYHNIDTDTITQSLCAAVYERRFHDAEAYLLTYIEHAMKTADTRERQTYMNTLNDIYTQFNDAYMGYVEAAGGSVIDEMQQLLSDDHDNVLIANASDAADMDDVLYEVLNYLADQMADDQHEAYKQVSFYRNYL